MNTRRERRCDEFTHLCRFWNRVEPLEAWHVMEQPLAELWLRGPI